MKYNTQNAKIASITEETLVLGIDVGSETHYVRAFDWRNYEFSDKHWCSVTMKPDSGHSWHGLRISRRKLAKPL